MTNPPRSNAARSGGSAGATEKGGKGAAGKGGRGRQEHSAGGVVVWLGTHGRGPLYLLIQDSYGNWGFPKGHVEPGEAAAEAAIREVREETGLRSLKLIGPIETIDWWFRFRGRLVHKVCDFFLMELGAEDSLETRPQEAEGITACEWESFEEARQRLSYANARNVLIRAHAMVTKAEADH
jgi:8-oxo-dGTP pyrophosphatase MutT (NUDIX family)